MTITELKEICSKIRSHGSYQTGRELAIEIAESGLCSELDSDVLALAQLYNDHLFCKFDLFHTAVEELLGRGVWTHEFADIERLRNEAAGIIPSPSVQEIMEMIPEEKRIVVCM
jgi:hypothetical protein